MLSLLSSKQKVQSVLKGFAELPAHPDFQPAMKVLKDRGIRMVALTNGPYACRGCERANKLQVAYVQQECVYSRAKPRGAGPMSGHLSAQFQREQLHDAAQVGDLDRVEQLLRAKYPVNRFDDLGKTPLHCAVQGGHLKVVNRLLAAGANVNAHDERLIGNTPLADNARDCSFEMAKRLIDAGADPTMKGWMQRDALHHAANRRDADADKVRVLLTEAAAWQGKRRRSPYRRSIKRVE